MNSERDLTRRSFIKNTAGIFVPAVLESQTATASTISNARPGTGPAIPKWPLPNQTRQIWMKRQTTGEFVIARYADNGRINYSEYLKCCRLLRDVKQNLTVHMDVELLDLVFAIQSWLVSWGYDKPMLITSGYRSPRTNASTEGAARNSLHVKGRAIDFKIPGIPMEYSGRLAQIFGVGGVGFYHNSNFTHIDTGSVRYWRA